MIWEHREFDLERKIEELEKQQNDIADAAKRVNHRKKKKLFQHFSFQFEEAIGNYPDPSLPVSHQLEQALKIIRDNIHLLMEAKIQQQLIGKVLFYCVTLH